MARCMLFWMQAAMQPCGRHALGNVLLPLRHGTVPCSYGHGPAGGPPMLLHTQHKLTGPLCHRPACPQTRTRCMVIVGAPCGQLVAWTSSGPRVHMPTSTTLTAWYTQYSHTCVPMSACRSIHLVEAGTKESTRAATLHKMRVFQAVCSTPGYRTCEHSSSLTR